MVTLSGLQVDLGGEWAFAYSLAAPSAPRTNMAALEDAGLHLLPCQVPGNFFNDLYGAGLIDNPRDVTTLPALQAYESAHVWYGCRFAAHPPAATTPWLVFDGLDCSAEVYLNGVLLGSTANALVPQRLALGDVLQEQNELLVYIHPSLHHARRHTYPPGLWAPPGHWEALHVRRPRHTYGSSVTPRAVSPGIWRGVHLDYQPREHLGQTYLETLAISPSRSEARLALHYDLSLVPVTETRYELGIELRCGTRVYADTRAITFQAGCCEFSLRDPQLWQPRDYGQANLYDVRLTLLRDGLVIDDRSFDLGIRTLALDQDRGLLVNNVPIFAQGATWGPVDCYHCHDHERIARLVDQLVDLGCNMIRCWGGNVYEDDLLYTLCDRKGILVWQDFAMVDAIYPQDDAFCGKLGVEAREVIRRLRQHPSLALWVGDCGGDDAWRQHGRSRQPADNRLTRQVLPALLAEEDPGRPYLPSAPAEDPLSLFEPSHHRFGAPPDPSPISCASPDLLQVWLQEELDAVDLVLGAWTERTPPDTSLEEMLRHLRTWFSSVPDDRSALCLASQYAQAESLKAKIEAHRAAQEQSRGVIWWHLADACAQISSAVVDDTGQPKVAYEAIKRAQQPLLLMLSRQSNGRLTLLASSHLARNEHVQYWVSDVDSFEMLIEGEGRVIAHAVTELGSFPAEPGIQRCLLIEWRDSHGALFHNHFLDGTTPYDLVEYQAWLHEAEL